MKIAALFLAVAIAGCSAGGLSPNAPAPVNGSSARGIAPLAKGGNTTAFRVSGRNITLSINGGQPSVFYIKGVDYSPTQICSSYIEPLNDANSAIWQQDLPQLRALGANAIKVYNTGMMKPQNTWQVKPMTQWLAAAYNGGVNPIYTIVSIHFDAGVISANPNKYAILSLSHQYYILAKTLGTNPDIMGISIGPEWNQQPLVQNPAMWKNAANPIIQAANQGLIDAGAAKLLTTTLVDDLGAGATSTMAEGEANGFPVGQFAWGYDSYRGYKPPFANLWPQVKQYTKRAFIASEWGSPTAFHPHPNSNPSLVTEWPSATISQLTQYVDLSAKSLYDHATVNPSAKSPAVDSGGFVFEWSDEWVKAQSPCTHIAGSSPGNPPAPNTGFPGGFDDEAWFGLNAVATASTASAPNKMLPRPNYSVLKADWAAQARR